MLKGYIMRSKERAKPEQGEVDYWFCEESQDAANWATTREDAEIECRLLNQHRIKITSPTGEDYFCCDFKAEERAPGEFVIYCMAPFTSVSLASGI
jgi:hypothetical protein